MSPSPTQTTEATPAPSIVEAHELRKHVGDFLGGFWAINGINFTTQAGQCYGLLGVMACWGQIAQARPPLCK